MVTYFKYAVLLHLSECDPKLGVWNKNSFEKLS